MVFNEIYGVYYRTVAKILEAALDGGVTNDQMRQTAERYAYLESEFEIIPALTKQRWQLLYKDGTTPLNFAPTIPLTELQKRWLKAISLDPRIGLFDIDFSALGDVPPLFTPDDYRIFDRFSDGDPYDDHDYKNIFSTCLRAVENRSPLKITMTTRKGRITTVSVIPDKLEYSEKDDKFRLISHGHGRARIINLARITSCAPCSEDVGDEVSPPKLGHLTIQLTDERNTLERVMLHFSHFKKETEKLGDNMWRLKIEFAEEDKTELVIRILSFGPTVKVIDPPDIVNEIKSRLGRQTELFG